MSIIEPPGFVQKLLSGLVLAAAVAVPGASARADSTEVPVARLDGAMTLGAVIDRIGRPSDVSDAGGACGGIVVHDWVAENIRVVTLGEMVDAVSPIRVEQAPASRTDPAEPQVKPGG